MILRDSVENIKNEYPELYQSILDKMIKKGATINDIEWYYSYCTIIDNSPDPISLQETIDDYKRRIGISLEAKFGKKSESMLIRNSGSSVDLPNVFVELAKFNWEKEDKKNKKEKYLISNLDSVLKSVGKNGSAKNNNVKFKVGNGLDLMSNIFGNMAIEQPTYPIINDIKKVKPEIYQKYLSLADGSNLVIYNPNHRECDEWGFFIEPILLATRRNNEDRFITTTCGNCYTINGDSLDFGGFLSGMDKAIAAKEGENFSGWKRTKQYRLTKQEIESQIKSKIFTFGGIKF